MDFAQVYRSCKRTQALSRGIKAVQENLDRIGVKYIDVKPAKIETFRAVSGYRYTTLEGVAFFPVIPIDVPKGHGLSWMRSAFSSADIVVPPYYAMGYLDRWAKKITEAGDHEEKIAVGDAMLADMYPADGIAELVTGVWSARATFEQFNSQLVEACKAYCLGLYSVAIVGLLPCIEGVIRKLGMTAGLAVEDSVGIRQLSKVFQKLQRRELEVMLDGYDWYPQSELNIGLLDHFHERVQMFESISAYLQTKLYLHTDGAPEYLLLNRNGIAHGLFSGYATKSNYLRLFNLLSALSFAAVLAEGSGSLMHPGDSPESNSLTLKLRKCELFGAVL